MEVFSGVKVTSLAAGNQIKTFMTDTVHMSDKLIEHSSHSPSAGWRRHAQWACLR